MHIYCTHIRMAKIQNTDTANAEEDEDQQELSFIVGGNAKYYSTITLEDSWLFLTKLNILLPLDPAIVLLDIYPKELKMKNLHKDVYGSFIHNWQNLEATKMSFSK